MRTLKKLVRCKESPPGWHAEFEAMIPIIENYAKIAFRHFDAEAREEAIQEVVCNACCAFARLAELGKTAVAFPGVLARFGVAQARDGRIVGGHLNAHDISSAYCQRRTGVVVGRLDHHDHVENEWQEVLIEDRHAGPAETAQARIDFPAWLRTLSRRNRKVAQFLAAGERTCDAARKFGVCEGRISQIRKELKLAWQAFHGEQPMGCLAAA